MHLRPNALRLLDFRRTRSRVAVVDRVERLAEPFKGTGHRCADRQVGALRRHERRLDFKSENPGPESQFDRSTMIAESFGFVRLAVERVRVAKELSIHGWGRTTASTFPDKLSQPGKRDRADHPEHDPRNCAGTWHREVEQATQPTEEPVDLQPTEEPVDLMSDPTQLMLERSTDFDVSVPSAVQNLLT